MAEILFRQFFQESFDSPVVNWTCHSVYSVRCPPLIPEVPVPRREPHSPCSIVGARGRPTLSPRGMRSSSPYQPIVCSRATASLVAALSAMTPRAPFAVFPCVGLEVAPALPQPIEFPGEDRLCLGCWFHHPVLCQPPALPGGFASPEETPWRPCREFAIRGSPPKECQEGIRFHTAKARLYHSVPSYTQRNFPGTISKTSDLQPSRFQFAEQR